jgi:hypothetical protein
MGLADFFRLRRVHFGFFRELALWPSQRFAAAAFAVSARRAGDRFFILAFTIAMA